MARALARRVGERVVLPLGSAVSSAAFGTFALLHDRTWHIVLTMAAAWASASASPTR